MPQNTFNSLPMPYACPTTRVFSSWKRTISSSTSLFSVETHGHLLGPSGKIRLKLLKTSCIGKSLVPTTSFSLRSLSSNRTALSANILSATRPAVSWYCSTLCTPSANWSILNSSLSCIAFSRSEAWFRRSRADDAVTLARIAACSGSRSDVSMSEGDISRESLVNNGGSAGGGLARAFHCSFSSCNLMNC